MLTQQRALVRMPEVVGLPFRKAKLLVEHAGLVVDQVVFMESYEERDTILSQSPTRGKMVYTGEKVTLGVSRESYVKWLPSIYQRNDVNGKNFVRDLLWIIQHLFSSIEEKLDVIHTFFDSYEAPEKFLPWLASWSAMVLDEDWPVTKKRRLIKKAIELYRNRGTVKGLKLFISLFTGHEPEIKENVWPFRGWRVIDDEAVGARIGVDTIVLPPVNLAHTFIVEMPVSYKDLSPEAVIRIHEIIQMEKPAHTQYYLRFAVEEKDDELREFMVIGTRSGIGVGGGEAEPEAITSEEELQKLLEEQAGEIDSLPQGGAPTGDPAMGGAPRKRTTSMGQVIIEDDSFVAAPRTRPPLPKAPRADLAPIEGREGDRTTAMSAAVVDPLASTSAAVKVPPARKVDLATMAIPAATEPPVKGKADAGAKTVLGEDRDALLKKEKEKSEKSKDPKDPKKK
jgi:phage tail-like protein